MSSAPHLALQAASFRSRPRLPSAAHRGAPRPRHCYRNSVCRWRSRWMYFQVYRRKYSQADSAAGDHVPPGRPRARRANVDVDAAAAFRMRTRVAEAAREADWDSPRCGLVGQLFPRCIACRAAQADGLPRGQAVCARVAGRAPGALRAPARASLSGAQAAAALTAAAGSARHVCLLPTRRF